MKTDLKEQLEKIPDSTEFCEGWCCSKDCPLNRELSSEPCIAAQIENLKHEGLKLLKEKQNERI